MNPLGSTNQSAASSDGRRLPIGCPRFPQVACTAAIRRGKIVGQMKRRRLSELLHSRKVQLLLMSSKKKSKHSSHERTPDAYSLYREEPQIRRPTAKRWDGSCSLSKPYHSGSPRHPTGRPRTLQNPPEGLQDFTHPSTKKGEKCWPELRASLAALYFHVSRTAQRKRLVPSQKYGNRRDPKERLQRSTTPVGCS